MRWKLLILASLGAAILGIGLWASFAIIFFGSARALARHDWLLPASAFIPLALVAYASVFVYRHTARRRKTQVVITAVVSILLALFIYLAASTVFVSRFVIPRTNEVRHAR